MHLRSFLKSSHIVLSTGNNMLQPQKRMRIKLHVKFTNEDFVFRLQAAICGYHLYHFCDHMLVRMKWDCLLHWLASKNAHSLTFSRIFHHCISCCGRMITPQCTQIWQKFIDFEESIESAATDDDTKSLQRKRIAHIYNIILTIPLLQLDEVCYYSCKSLTSFLHT